MWNTIQSNLARDSKLYYTTGLADLTPHIPGVISTNVQDGPFKIFIGNIPTYLTEDQV